MTDQTTTPPRPRTPSVSELQAALLAAHPDGFTAQPPRAGAVASQQLAVTLLGSHGGSGATCLSVLLPGVELADRAWSCEGDRPVVLVCRSTLRGLSSAQDHAREHRDGDCGHAVLLGVVIVADAPGRTPPSLIRLERLLAGAVPVLGHVPWMEPWRTGAPTNPVKQPGWLRELTSAIAAADPGRRG